MLTGGPIVDAVWRRLLERAGPRPGLPLTDDPDLHLLVDGRRVNARRRRGGFRVFRLPAPPHEVRIVSRAASPQEVGLARDPRVLGIAVRRIVISQARRLRVLDAADPTLDTGFHDYETAEAIRWTQGDARLPAELFAGFTGPLLVELQLGGSTQYPLFGEQLLVA